MSPVEIDSELTRAVTSALRAPWLTPLLVLLSAWPVKGPLLAGLAALQPAPLGRRLRAAVLVGVAAMLGSLASSLIKTLVERARPLEAGALVALPDTASFPSGHATTAAAAAAALALLVPRWRLPAATLALLVGISRVLLGVHYVGDVLAGLALGAGIGAVVGLAGRRLAGGRGR